MTLLDSLLGRNRDLEASLPYATPLGTSDFGLSTPFAASNALESATFAHLWELADYIPVNRGVAMNIGVLAKGRNLLAPGIGSLPLVHMTGSKRTERQPMLCRQPEVGRPRSATMTWISDGLYWFGRAWLLTTDRYAEDRRPARFQWVPEWSAEVDSAGFLVKAFGKPVFQGDVVMIAGPHEGILNYASGKIQRATAIDLAAGNAADNPVPSVELHQTGGTPLTDEQIDALTARWVAARKRKGGGVAYTSQAVEAKIHGLVPEQLLIAAQARSDLDLARVAGMPAWAADVSIEGSNLTYSNSPSRARELIDFMWKPYMDAITDRLSMDDVMPAGQWCRFDTTSLLQGNFAERMTGYKAAIEAGIYTVEQCQQIEAGIAPEGIAP